MARRSPSQYFYTIILIIVINYEKLRSNIILRGKNLNIWIIENGTWCNPEIEYNDKIITVDNWEKHKNEQNIHYLHATLPFVHRGGFTMPRGYGWIRNPKKYAYNKVYNKTTFDIFKVLKRLFKWLELIKWELDMLV